MKRLASEEKERDDARIAKLELELRGASSERDAALDCPPTAVFSDEMV